MSSKQVRRTLSKLFTLMIDRRFLFYTQVVAFMLVIFPLVTEQHDAVDQHIVLVAQAAAVLGGAWIVIKSWGERPPSGLDYDKIVYDRTGELARILRQLGIDEG